MGRKIQNLADELFSMQESERSLERLPLRIALYRIREDVGTADRDRYRGPGMGPQTERNRVVRKNRKGHIPSVESGHNGTDDLVFQIG